MKTNVTGYANVTAGDEMALQAAVWSSGVISAAINADADAFMFYSGGPSRWLTTAFSLRFLTVNVRRCCVCF